MRRGRRGRAGMVVAMVLAHAACGDDDGGPGGETAASTLATTDDTGGTTEGQTEASTEASTGGTGDTSGAMDSSSTGEPQILPNCEPANDEPMCMSTFGCVWDHTPGHCVVDCNIILDEAVCLDQDDCDWDGQACGGMPN